MPAQQHRRRALEYGCEEFHAKPVDPKVLERLLGDASASS